MGDVRREEARAASPVASVVSWNGFRPLIVFPDGSEVAGRLSYPTSREAREAAGKAIAFMEEFPGCIVLPCHPPGIMVELTPTAPIGMVG